MCCKANCLFEEISHIYAGSVPLCDFANVSREIDTLTYFPLAMNNSRQFVLLLSVTSSTQAVVWANKCKNQTK